MIIPGPGKVELVYTAEDGTETRELVHNYTGAGIAQGMHNLDASIESFARSCFNYALDIKQDLWFATKDTISKNTIIHLKIFSKRFMIKNMMRNSKLPELSISIH